MNKSKNEGCIRTDEAYSKTCVIERLGISQRFWDQMLDQGLPFTVVGHSRWVTGVALMEYLTRFAQTKQNRAE